MIYQFELSELEFRLFRDFIHEKFGIYLKDEKISFIQMKLYPRVLSLGLSSFGDYLNLIKYDPDGEKELSRMVSLLTNNETYFFRELPQLKVFRDVLLPQLREKKISRSKKIRVVSAGCSTGEEVYTLAMLTFETGSFFWDWDVRIVGMDISETALEAARRGIYYNSSFRMTEPAYVKKFFSYNSGDYQAKDNIKRMTSFVYGNITDQQTWEGLRDVDVIFCRNVLIYFSEEKVKTAVNNLSQAMRKGGHLLLGHSETLTGISDDFELVRFPETFIYQKKGA
ncbi:MAG: protein-glutamate O-methyltransferase CheR [Deltaproteobacteria bacterium]|nr:MAG: protein-glutamate O-methyltransferase CheR [Deltaproteobacteria bacterium]